MAAGGNSCIRSKKHGFTRALASAVLEWLLIFLLFMDAILSYIITRFARYCELQTPCVLCSRIDHVFGKEKSKYYWDLICRNHKLEMSSLVFCHAHNKLVDVHGMCENCLLSFATVNKSNAETYRLLVGKVGEDSSFDFHEDASNIDSQSSIKQCSCCHEPWISRGYDQKLIQTDTFASEAAELDEPLSAAVEHDQNHLKRRSDKPSVSMRATHQESRGLDHMSHVGYSELKIISDSESEVVLSDDDDDAIDLKHETDGAEEHFAAQCVQLEPRIITLSRDLALEKLIDPVSETEPSLPFSHVQSDVIEPHSATSVASTTADGHGWEELNWEHVDIMADPSALIGLISLDDIPPSSNVGKTSIDVSKENKFLSLDDVPLSPNAGKTSIDVSKESKFVSLDDVPPSPNAGKTSIDVSKESKFVSLDDIPSSPNAGKTSINVSKESKFVSLDDVPPSPNAEKTSIDVLKESELFYHGGLPSPNSRECPVDVSPESKVISVDDVPLPSNASETPVYVSEERKHISLNDIPQSSNGRDTPEVSEDSKVILLDDVPPLSKPMELPVEAPTESCIPTGIELEETSVTDCEEICNAESVPNTSTTSLQASNLLDLSDAYKVAVGNRGRQSSGVLAEQRTGKDSSKLSEDLKVLLSQLSATRGFEQFMPDMSPRVFINSDEFKNLDASSTNGIQILQRRISLERNESGLSLDGSSISEIEGESAVDRLKRQIEHDKKLLSAMYKELEEERNASAVAVNQAMAMITRLQEEKASLHMEALQNLRMMEEQAEYDMEALQYSNDLLAEKEKVIQELETELEFYRKKFPNESMFKARELNMNHPEVAEDMNTSAVKSSLLEFEDEKSYILQSLKKLEKKLYMFSYNGIYPDLSNGEHFGNEGDDLSMINNASASDGEHASSLEKHQTTSKENTEIDLASLGNEVSDLNERLESLEADQNFLELTINSLKKGEDGIRFVRDIASHLRELRTIGIRRD